MTTHTAVATTAKGVIDSIQLSTPEPGPGQVLVKVEYASLMAFDVYVVDDGFFVPSYPQTLGFNAAGTIAKVGPDVKDLAVGDLVYLSNT
jgi:NADPH:quinone reductase-like Zn-dependent oxidoreductase